MNVALWNATSDKESMAADALNNKAKIIVKDGKATMYISTKEMTFGTIKASLQEFYIGNSSCDYSILEVNKKIIKIIVLQLLKKMHKDIQHYGPLYYLMKMNISMS